MSAKKVRFIHNVEASAPDRGLMYVNCEKCTAELPPGTSPKAHARQQVAFTPDGFQVWCTRHDCNITDVTVAAIPVNVNAATKAAMEETDKAIIAVTRAFDNLLKNRRPS